MATREELSMALDDLLFITGVQRSMVCNAAEYKVRLAEGQAIEDVIAIQQANAENYLRLLNQRQTNWADPNLAQMISNGLTDLGINPPDHQAALTSSITQAQTEFDAKPVDAASLDSATLVSISTLAPSVIDKAVSTMIATAASAQGGIIRP